MKTRKLCAFKISFEDQKFWDRYRKDVSIPKVRNQKEKKKKRQDMSQVSPKLSKANSMTFSRLKIIQFGSVSHLLDPPTQQFCLCGSVRWRSCQVGHLTPKAGAASPARL